MHKKHVGFILAASAAALFATASFADNAVSTATAATVHCMGINACKGQSVCKTASNSCKGQNDCRGKGWLEAASAKECKQAGGTVAK